MSGRGGGNGQYLPPNVEEALQFTPFTSVVPVRSDEIPVPVLQPPGSEQVFTNAQEREFSERQLRKLNAEAERSPHSSLVSGYLDELSSYLSPTELSTYSFKRPSTIGSSSGGIGIAVPDATAARLPPTAGAFEELLLRQSRVQYSYAPQDGQSQVYTQNQQSYYVQQPSAPPHRPTISHPSPLPNPPQPPSYSAQPPHTPSSSHLRVEIKGTPTMSPSAKLAAAAVVISPSRTFNKDEYVKDEKLDKRLKISKPVGTSVESKNRKRKRSFSILGDEQPVTAGVDKRAKAESIAQSFNNMLSNIFEAQDSLEADTSGRMVETEKSAKYWVLSSIGTDYPCLSTHRQGKLETSIRSVIEVGRFNLVPVDDLLRLQKLCDNAIKSCELLSIKIPESTEQVEAWVQSLSTIDNGLKTARTILRILTAGREEKQLYSEDILQSLLRFLKLLVEDLAVPLAEMRNNPSNKSASELFKALQQHKKTVGGLISDMAGLFRMLAYLLTKEQISEDAITTIEFTMLPIIFMENPTQERDSLLGTARVDRFRVNAMDVLEKIFSQYSNQQTFLFDQILGGLEKLPVHKQTARTYKLDDGKNIQHISALIMRLVQATAGYHPPKSTRTLKAVEGEDSEEDAPRQNGVEKVPNNSTSSLDPDRNPGEVIEKLGRLCNPLVETAYRSANHVVNYLINRAMNTTKSGDSPYRLLLDLFTEDFITVLGRPEWPGAEVVLHQILLHSIRLIDDPKTAATVRTMCLEMLGFLGSGMCDLMVYIKSHHHRFDGNDHVSEILTALRESYLQNTANDDEDLLNWQGPYRAVIEYLIDHSHEGVNQSACDYLLAAWGKKVDTAYGNLDGSDEDLQSEYAHIGANLCRLIIDHTTVDDEFQMDPSQPLQQKLASLLLVINGPLCRNFDAVLQRLLRSIDSDQATIRTKALKAVMALVNKDHALLDKKQLVPFIMDRSRDSSTLVRDAAVGLLGEIVTIRPDMEERVFKCILDRAADAGAFVRKRAIKILKDFYLRDNVKDSRVQISEALLFRINDIDAGVSELARKTYEEIWVAPCYREISDDPEDDKLPPKSAVKASVDQMLHVATSSKNDSVARSEKVERSMIELVYNFLSKDNKSAAKNFKVFKVMVASMFDSLLEAHADSDKPLRQSILQTLTVFAIANSKLFTLDQLEQLQPYVDNLATNDDLLMYRSVVVIYRNVFPSVSSFQHSFLEKVQTALLKNLSRTPIKGMKEAIECLWCINHVLKDPERLIRVTISCMGKVKSVKPNTNQEAQVKALVRVFNILGNLGMICDFTGYEEAFRKAFPQWQGNSVPSLITDIGLPFCTKDAEPHLRRAALDCLGNVCQTHGFLFLEQKVLDVYNAVFEERNRDLEELVLQGFRGFLRVQEDISSDKLKAKEETPEQEPVGGRLATQLNASQEDGVSTALSQQYLSQIIRIATASMDHYALTATEVIGSILRQGLVHPKACVAALVALETSPQALISGIAFKEHQRLHTKHEGIVERGYMEGVRQCFIYQRDVVRNKLGALTNAQPPVSVLHKLYELLNGSQKKNRQKFLSNLVQSLDFDSSNLKEKTLREHLEYARFISENLAFFEYTQLADVYKVVAAMESIASSTGVAIQHFIETEIFFIGKESTDDRAVDSETLLLHALAAAILSVVWAARTNLRKLYNLNEQKIRDFRRGKLSAKETSRPPAKAPFVNISVVMEEIEGIVGKLETPEEQMQRCQDFVELLKIDSEFRLPEDEEEFDVERTPEDTDEEEEGAIPEPATPGTKRKRKMNESPVKKARRKPNPKPRKPKKGTDPDAF